MVGRLSQFLWSHYRRRKFWLGLSVFSTVWLLIHSVSLLSLTRNDYQEISDYKLLQEYIQYEENYHRNDKAFNDAIEELKGSLRRPVSLSSQAKRILSEHVCAYTKKDLTSFPDCERKLEWMKGGWKTHNCYAEYGVDGSICSFVIYLSEVEHHCPYLRWRKKSERPAKAPSLASERKNESALFDLMNDNAINYEFMKTRISRLWPKWLAAYDELLAQWPHSLADRKKLKIVIHLGFLTKEAGFKFGQKAGSGGPLGELVQWSDLIAALYILGHDLFISSETATFKSNMGKFTSKTPCYDPAAQNVDILFTDIVGVRFMRRKMNDFYVQKKCILRVLDSFGSHAEFNIPTYFKSHKKELGGGPNPWGGHQLELQQFMTLYPHTDDNTFLGFLVEMHSVKEDVQREDAALVYGKEIYMWNNSEQFLKKVSELTQLHATVADVKDLSSYGAINHGLLSGFEYHSLLRRVKIFLGLGFPLEGPAPLEAIANGAVFINPGFYPPKSRLTYKFFKDKPTLRQLTSQNPYVEHFIGRPHVLTVNMSDLDAVEKVVKEALTLKPEPFLPFEFTATGMLQRVNTLISKQNFCTPSEFPPRTALQIEVAGSAESCQQTCAGHGLMCERSFFKFANDSALIKKLNHCDSIVPVASPFAPYACTAQLEPMLFSCASTPTEKSIRRICPCRDFIKNQVALCSSCL